MSPFDPNSADREALRDYLGEADVHLLDGAGDVENIPNTELNGLLNEGEGLANTLELLSYLNRVGSRFHSVSDLTDALKKARILRRREKDKLSSSWPIDDEVFLLSSTRSIFNLILISIFKQYIKQIKYLSLIKIIKYKKR